MECEYGKPRNEYCHDCMKTDNIDRSAVKCCVICPACGEEVTPKQVKRIARQGNIMSFYSIEYDCPKCGMERIWDR